MTRCPSLLLCFLSAMIGCAAIDSPQERPAATRTDASGAAATPEQHTPKPAPERPPARVRIRAVGDLMAHAVQLRAASRGEGRFDWSSTFEGVRPLLEDADLTYGNLETTLSGHDLYYSGYPTFNTPDSYADALDAAGFDLLQTANNHSRDRRKLGVDRTIAALEQRSLRHVGTFASAADAENPAVHRTIRGVRMAFLAYTYGTNDIPPEPNEDWTVAHIDLPQMLADIAAARTAGAEAVVLGLHWGDDYVHEPQQDQRDLAQALINGGADLLLGGHPHVLQPAEWLQDANSDRRGLVFWSLGNFLSNQRELPRSTGVVIEATFVRTQQDGPVTLEAPRFAPVWTDADDPSGAPHFRLRPLLAETPSSEDPVAAAQLQLTTADCETMRQATGHALPFFAGLEPIEATVGPASPPPNRQATWDEALPDSQTLWPASSSPNTEFLGHVEKGMVHIPAALALLGTAEGEGNERPREVSLASYAIDLNEVTTDEYARFLSVTPDLRLPGTGVSWAGPWTWKSRVPPKGQRGKPVSLISRSEASAFCAWRGDRLPTEDEWEYAARGPQSLIFPWGQDWVPTHSNWFDRPREGAERVDGAKRWASPGSYPAGRSPFGLFDMSGNVAEWTSTPYADTELGVIKGGSWFTNNPHWLRPAFRYFTDPEERSTIYGFRCARSL